jgi:exodeoxyribonuclease V beta subunit
MEKFDLAAPKLETGRVVIQASAGTGKTYSLTVLAIRHIAELNLKADQLLIVTFTNAATAELREKTRDQAKETLQCLRDKNRKHSWMSCMLANEDSRLVAISNLENFIAHFDQATISTIHGFCQIVLRRIGLDSPAPKNYEVHSNIDEIIDQVITDKLVATLSHDPKYLAGNRLKTIERPVTTDEVKGALSQLRKAVSRAMNNPKAVLLPETPPSLWASDIDAIKDDWERKSTLQAIKIAQTVKDVIAEVHRRSYEAGIITYDDMVRLVAKTLNNADEYSDNLASSLADQYRLVMVDEFQDTDAAQWSIFSKIHASRPNETTLITVGDPKQAIYRFRGADVQVYINAIRDVPQSYEIKTNYRSDEKLLVALEKLLINKDFAEGKAAEFTEVEPAERNRPGALTTNSSSPPLSIPGAPLEIRYLSNNETLGAEMVKDKAGNVKWANNNDGYSVDRVIWLDIANHVVELLQHGNIPDKSTDFPYTPRPISPNDIAILVNGHNDAETVVRYLNDADVPAVRFKTDNVFGSQAAMHLLMLLGALANPGKPQYVRAYALSWFGKGTTEELAIADEDAVAEWQRECAENAELLRTRGVSALFLSYRNKSEFLQRVLGQQDGERHITDLDHIVEILASDPHLAQRAGADEYYETLVNLTEGTEEETEEFQRRIEGDKNAVKVMTIHSSKGLQFPIVFLPTLMNRPPSNSNNPKMFSYRLPEDTSSTRVIDVASGIESAKKWILVTADEKFDLDERDRLFKDDVLFDSKRLLYVALTRAEHKVILYWSAIGENNKKGNINTALAEFLASHLGVEKPKIPLDKEPLSALMNSIASASDDTISATHLSIEPVAKLTWSPKTTKGITQTGTAQYLRTEQLSTFGYSRWSYSKLSRLLSDDHEYFSTAEVKGSTDETNITSAIPTAINEIGISTEEAASSMPLYAIRGSNIFGNAVHEIIDSIDPADPNLAGKLESEVELHFKNSHNSVECSKIVEGITKSFHAPLGEQFGGNTLISLGSTHRLSELEFNFLLPQSSSEAFSPNRIGELMLEHGKLNAQLSDYAQTIANSNATGVIAGFMNGSIDAVFRVSADSTPRYIVSDYKTNRLHNPENKGVNPLLAYHPDNLVTPMVENDYILQALVYSVALHRYLQWRQPAYDPDKHLGGAAYLFLRGMTGFSTDETTPRPYGVYHWRPTTGLVLALDALFAGRSV